MKILITGNALDNFSGQPLSTYELARELSKEHQVNFITMVGRLGDNELKQNLEKCGVTFNQYTNEPYDIILANEWCPNVSGYKINIVRSEYDVETPIPNMDFYVCIRPSIQEHIIKEHAIPKEKTIVIYNGVDRNRFKPVEKKKRVYKLIVIPCTLDKLREKFLNYAISQANPKQRILIIGDKYDANLTKSKYVEYKKPTFNIEKYIAQADEVWGILLGRVNIEANSCGVMSRIFDPITLENQTYFLEEEEFDKRHNINNTVKYLLQLYGPTKTD